MRVYSTVFILGQISSKDSSSQVHLLKGRHTIVITPAQILIQTFEFLLTDIWVEKLACRNYQNILWSFSPQTLYNKVRQGTRRNTSQGIMRTCLPRRQHKLIGNGNASFTESQLLHKQCLLRRVKFVCCPWDYDSRVAWEDSE